MVMTGDDGTSAAGDPLIEVAWATWSAQGDHLDGDDTAILAIADWGPDEDWTDWRE